MPVNITTRAGKGAPLTNNEVDANFTNLKTSADASETAIETIQETFATQTFAKQAAKKAVIKFGS